MPLDLAALRKTWPRVRLPVTAAAIFSATLGVAHAQDFCAKVDRLIDQSQSGFSKIAAKPKGNAGDHDVTLTLAGASYCSVTRKSKRNWYHCAWEFPHRAKQAYETFEEIAGKLTACIGGRATLHSDRSVNHPDYYASRRYELKQADVSVSVKDKGALGSTFVFVRVQGRRRN